MRSSRVIIAMLLVTLAAESAAQESAASRPHVIVAQIGAGGSLSHGPEQSFPADAEESRFGPSLTARVLWRPGHLLGIGAQSGLTRVSTLETAETDRTLALWAVPAMIVFSMEAHGFDASVAAGWQRYIVGTSRRVISSAWEMSYSLSAAYTFYSSGPLRLGVEATWASLPERETGFASLQVRGAWVVGY